MVLGYISDRKNKPCSFERLQKPCCQERRSRLRLEGAEGCPLCWPGRWIALAGNSRALLVWKLRAGGKGASLQSVALGAQRRPALQPVQPALRVGRDHMIVRDATAMQVLNKRHGTFQRFPDACPVVRFETPIDNNS